MDRRPSSNSSQPRRIGLGVIGYYGPAHDTVGGQPIYQAYVAKLKHFVQWLLSQGYSIRLLTGDLENDSQPADELLAFVRSEGLPAWQAHIVIEPIATVDELSRQISETEIVVASRFHNLIGALMLDRPVISIGFHPKNDALMAEMDLQNYCQQIEQLDVDRLIEQFQALLAELPQVVQRIQQKNSQYRQLLDEQYRRVLCAAANSALMPSLAI
jgi:polysaccharide pyruvyl transferase WcaK-like protein